ncbi:MAG: acyltransferase [Aureispira sp.]|nr:acyltransferase [Aureispira sp.]
MFKLLQQELNKDRIWGLDLLRALAITMVLIEHSQLFLSPIFRSTNFMRLGGYWGVELFFVLSGFLIGGILLKTYDTNNTKFNKKKLLTFWKRRWYRTLPSYFLILLVNTILVVFFPHFIELPKDYPQYFFFLQNFTSEHSSFFGEAWSLSVEEWFYIIFPLLLFLINSISNKYISQKNKFLSITLSILAFSIIMRIQNTTDPNAYWDKGYRKIVIFRFDAILTGVFIAWINYYYLHWLNQFKKELLGIGIILLICSCFIYYTDILKNGTHISSFFAKTFYFNLTSLGFALCLPFAYSIKKGKASKFTKWIKIIAIVSYSIYLTHCSIIIWLLLQFQYLNTSFFSAIIFYTAFWILSLILAIILYNFFEKPFTNLRDKN